jgi:hypothetical protein
MTLYCTDADLLSWEPDLPREASFASQTLLANVAASLAGTTLTLASGSFADSRVRAGHVVVLSGTVSGCFPILSVDSPTTCTISAQHEGLLDEPPTPAPAGTAASVSVTVRTFAPQRIVTSEMLTRLGGVEPTGSQRITNVAALRRPAVLGTLHMVYSALSAAGGDESADLIVRAELYERLFRRSLRAIIVEVDTNGDGEPDLRRMLRSARLVRA